MNTRMRKAAVTALAAASLAAGAVAVATPSSADPEGRTQARGDGDRADSHMRTAPDDAAMERMMSEMRRDPGMQRMMELMHDGNPGMQRMHGDMSDGSR